MDAEQHYSQASIELPGMKALRLKHEEKMKNTIKAPKSVKESLNLTSTLETPSMSTYTEEDAMQKLTTCISGESRGKGAAAHASPGGYLDGVDQAIKYETKEKVAVRRKKQYAQVKPYFQY